MSSDDTLVNAVIGAVVTIVTTFTVVGPVLGGAVAGYLNRTEGVRVGALSGAIAAIPGLLLAFFAGSMFAFMPVMGRMMGAGPGPGMVGGFGLIALIIAVVVFLLYSLGLGALGGYLGEYLYDRDIV